MVDRESQVFLSIVTISFNQVSFLRRTIESVLSQKTKDIEYIVVDPGSKDGSRELLQGYSRDIDLLVLEPDEGPADGLNRGFSASTGAIGYFLNSDDFLMPGAINNLRTLWAKNAEADILLCGGWMVNSCGEPMRELRSTPVSLDRLLDGSSVLVQQGMSFKMKCFRDAGGFNVANRTCWDKELLCDMLKRDAVTRTSDLRVAAFRIHSASISGGAGGELVRRQYKIDTDRISSKILDAGPVREAPHPVRTRLRKYLENPGFAFRLVRDRMFPSLMRSRWRRDIGVNR